MARPNHPSISDEAEVASHRSRPNRHYDLESSVQGLGGAAEDEGMSIQSVMAWLSAVRTKQPPLTVRAQPAAPSLRLLARDGGPPAADALHIASPRHSSSCDSQEPCPDQHHRLLDTFTVPRTPVQTAAQCRHRGQQRGLSKHHHSKGQQSGVASSSCRNGSAHALQIFVCLSVSCTLLAGHFVPIQSCSMSGYDKRSCRGVLCSTRETHVHPTNCLQHVEASPADKTLA